MAKHHSRTQKDLFEDILSHNVHVGVAERAKALEQLRQLLTEAIEIGSVEPEAGDDKDHA